MPTLLRIGGMRFFFYAADGFEPPHVHVEVEARIAKIWLYDLTVAKSAGLSHRQLSDAVEQVRQHQSEFLEKWDAFFGR
jgi:hypothetical protein